MPDWVLVALSWSSWGLGGLAVLLAVGWCRTWFLGCIRRARMEGELATERRVREAACNGLRDRVVTMEEALRNHGRTVDSCGSAVRALLQAQLKKQQSTEAPKNGG